MGNTSFAIFSRRVVLGTGAAPATVFVEGERITRVEPGDAAANAIGLIDVGDLVVMPGVIDAHVHVNEPGRTDWEGFHSAGRAAAAGGVTTIVVMPLNCTPAATTAGALLGEARAAAGTSPCEGEGASRGCEVDFGLWGGVVPGNSRELRPMWEAGALGFKCFLVHSGVEDFPGVSRADLMEAMPVLRDLGAPLLVHAEDPGVIDSARAGSGLNGAPWSYAAYLASRPPLAEDKAVEMMIELCRVHCVRTHIVHVASASALPLIAAAKREGLTLSAETCPHYLSLSAEGIGDAQTQFKCAPPIRDGATREALWGAIREGVLDMVASDHSPCPPGLKRLEDGDFAAAWGGISSLQLTLPVLWTHASERGLGLEDMPRLLCAAPARLAGIDSFKGRIAPGYDADLVVWDPRARWTVRGGALHHRHKVTPYDGATVRGAVCATFVRGRLVYADPVAWAGPVAHAEMDDNGLLKEACGRWVKRSRA